MKRQFLATRLAALVSLHRAAAQPDGSSGQTGQGQCPEVPTLRQSAAATATVNPDEPVADLAGLANAKTAVTAQRKVNELMARANKAAEGAFGIKASFRDYSVQLVEGQHPGLLAQQTLELRGGDGDALLDLVGRPQALGLASGRLDWHVSAASEQDAQRDATIAALTALRAEAAAAAAALGMEVDHLQSVTIDGGPQVMPMARTMAGATMKAPAMPPLQATPEKEDITASAKAEVVLRSSSAERRPRP